MTRRQEAPPGRLVVSTIYSSMDALSDCLQRLESRFGRVMYETGGIPCSNADRYREEMGNSLKRRFFSFERLVSRDSLPEIKTACCKVEPDFSDRVDDFVFRTVNIDPGIMTPDNLVMASHRELSHRIYLENGVFAEITLIYSRDRFTRLPWTDPDFCHEEAVDFFDRVRGSFELVGQV